MMRRGISIFLNSDFISAYFWSDWVELNGARITDREDAFLNPEF